VDGPLPATGSVAALITASTGREPYFNAIDAHSETAVMVGDRMDTDVVSGLEAGMETILVLSGLT
jgi:NagD protein